MFASLKNKIKEETGNDIQSIPPSSRSSILPNRRGSRLSSTTSIASTIEDSNSEQKDTEVNTLRSQYNELSAKYYELNKRFEIVQEERNNIERANQILLESVKVAQNQKDLVSEEQEKIQNCQYSEIEKLKGLLSFREQEAVDHLAKVKQNQQQIENLTIEVERLKILEPMLEDLKEQAGEEIQDLKTRLSASDERLNDYVENSEQVTLALRKQITLLQEQVSNLTINLETERQEKNAALLRIAELSQSEEILRKDLRIERNECNELHEKLEDLQQNLNQTTNELNDIKQQIIELNTVINSQSDRMEQVDTLTNELNEKNKSIKVLNQRLADLKKTFQNELQCKTLNSGNSDSTSGQTAIAILNNEKTLFSNMENYKISNGLHNSTMINSTCNSNNNNSNNNYKTQSIGVNNTDSGGTSSGGPIIMDEVNFKYLKHVIVKFLTSREVEARHLIRAVATLLHLTTDEEKLLHDTLNWKMSWFGTKPDHRSGQRAFSIPPS